MESNIAAWMIGGGRDLQEGVHERERGHRRALRDARLAAGEPVGLGGKLLESIRSAFASTRAQQIDPSCCPA